MYRNPILYYTVKTLVLREIIQIATVKAMTPPSTIVVHELVCSVLYSFKYIKY